MSATATVIAAPPTFKTVADVIEAAGVPAEQIVFCPTPGTATEADVIAYDKVGESYELVDGILIRKVMGAPDDRIAHWLGYLISHHVAEQNLGVVGGSQALLRLAPGAIRMPDICFTPWDAADDEDLAEAIQPVVPTLVVEVISPSNRKGNMAKKLDLYAAAGVKLVWYVYSLREEVDVYPNGRARSKKTLTAADTLTGGKVLPGFTLPVAKIFERRRPA